MLGQNDYSITCGGGSPKCGFVICARPLKEGHLLSFTDKISWIMWYRPPASFDTNISPKIDTGLKMGIWNKKKPNL